MPKTDTDSDSDANSNADACGWSADEGGTLLEARYGFALIPDALWRRLMRAIGERVGRQASYARDSLTFLDGASGAEARLDILPEAVKTWAGAIRVQTRGAGAAALMTVLMAVVEKACNDLALSPDKTRPESLPDAPSLASAPETSSVSSPKSSQGREQPRVAPQAAIQPDHGSGKECFISYKHPTTRDEAVDAKLSQALKRVREQISAIGYTEFIDQTQMKRGAESFKKFMDRAIHTTNKAVIILSDPYLRSASCVYELVGLYKLRQNNPNKFRDHVRVVKAGELNIYTPENWQYWKKFWKDEEKRYFKIIADDDGDVVDQIKHDWMSIGEFNRTDIGDIIAKLSKTTIFEDVERFTFGASLES